jgi:hypothetical protein
VLYKDVYAHYHLCKRVEDSLQRHCRYTAMVQESLSVEANKAHLKYCSPSEEVTQHFRTKEVPYNYCFPSLDG